METLDWTQRSDLLDATALEQALSGISIDANVRIDMRAMHLSLACLGALVCFLRRVTNSSVCVGNNGFSFDAFYNKLTKMSAIDLFTTDRISLGWTEQDIAIGHMAAQARTDGRVLQLMEAIEKTEANIEKMRIAHDNDHAKLKSNIEDDIKASREKHAASDKRSDVIRRRIEDLEGYNTNAALCIEYAVGDAVDDLMQELGYRLEVRMHRIKLYDEHGSNNGEIDGLLSYIDPNDEKKRVVVAVEAKSNMTPGEFEKVPKNIRHLRNAISTGLSAAGDIKYRKLCYSLAVLQGAQLVVAVGAPVVPAEIVSDAAELSYLVVQGVREGQYKPLDSSQVEWIKKL
jgi:hypothetical protein